MWPLQMFLVTTTKSMRYTGSGSRPTEIDRITRATKAGQRQQHGNRSSTHYKKGPWTGSIGSFLHPLLLPADPSTKHRLKSDGAQQKKG